MCGHNICGTPAFDTTCTTHLSLSMYCFPFALPLRKHLCSTLVLLSGSYALNVYISFQISPVQHLHWIPHPSHRSATYTAYPLHPLKTSALHRTPMAGTSASESFSERHTRNIRLPARFRNGDNAAIPEVTMHRRRRPSPSIEEVADNDEVVARGSSEFLTSS